MTENIEAGNGERNNDEEETVSRLPLWARRILAFVEEVRGNVKEA